MKNIIVMGSGRSGTSMVAGCFAKSGYFMGDDLWEARDANPKGFFEDREINEINEDLLDHVVPPRLSIFGKTFFRNRPIKWQRWLAALPLNIDVRSTPQLDARIAKIVSKSPFCLKDPRFSYTLPAWRPFLQDTVFICVFRDPASTAASIYKECHEVPHLSDPETGISISMECALKIWMQMYLSILSRHRHQGSWLFLHYNQLLTEDGLNKLEQFTGAGIDRDFPTASLSRSRARIEVPQKTVEVYLGLCELAGYHDAAFV